ncbi:MAG TPA: cyanoglobin [Polyangiaceae bacterium]|nr:cyanoglobin [Polyangiaceae bacterium]
MTDRPPLGPDFTPYDALGRDAAVALAARFYDHMDAHEPALVAVHRKDESGARVAPVVRDRFTLFLVEWLGGPNDYSRAHGHPRLRMRHAHVKVDSALRDAWLRCMNAALEHPSVPEDVRAYLRRRFADVADFLRNTEDRA